MSSGKPIRRVAIIGTGVIGVSWSAQFLGRGLNVVATDPGPNAEANLRHYVDAAWPARTAIGLSADASRDRLTFVSDPQQAVSEADFVQENARPNGPISRSSFSPNWMRRRLRTRSSRRVRPV
jgi:3-hydroxyacyl-CoA dehydrogenase